MGIGAKYTVNGINYSVIGINNVQVGYGLTSYPHTSALPRDYVSEKVTIPSYIDVGTRYVVTEVSAHAFYSCIFIKAIEIPCTITTLNWSCFGGMTQLELFIVPPNTKLIKLGEGVFHGDYMLKNFFMPSTVKSIEFWFFQMINASIWYSGTRRFTQDFCETSCTIHVPYYYKYNSFGNITVIKDYVWPRGNCITSNYNKRIDMNMCVIFVIYTS